MIAPPDEYRARIKQLEKENVRLRAEINKARDAVLHINDTLKAVMKHLGVRR